MSSSNRKDSGSSGGIELRVGEALVRDVGSGRARVDPAVISKAGWTTGDVIEISGKKRTFAFLWPGQPSDAGKGTIRIDGYLRNDSGVGIDDKVRVKKTEAMQADSITFAPTQPLRITGGEEYLGQMLDGRIVAKGMIIPIPVMNGRIDLQVTHVSPGANAVIVNPGTQITISEEVAKPERNIPRVNYEDVGGLRDEITKVREMIETPTQAPRAFRQAWN